MEINLKQKLIKFTEKDANPRRTNEINEELRKALNNVESLSKEDISAIVNYQDEDGGFKMIQTRSFDGDTMYDLWFVPTYLCTSILIRLSNKGIYEADEKVMKKALKYSSSREFASHGYNSAKDRLTTTLLFLESGALEYLNKHEGISSEFKSTIYRILDASKLMLKNKETVIGWGENVEDLLTKIVSYDNRKEIVMRVTVSGPEGLLISLPVFEGENPKEVIEKAQKNWKEKGLIK